MKSKKGISPLIATVLIIGFTIVLAALVITWGNKLFQDTVENTGKQSDLSLACTNLEYTTSAKKSSNNINIDIANKKEGNIYGFYVIAKGDLGSKTFSTDDSVIGGGNALAGGGLNAFESRIYNLTIAGVNLNSGYEKSVEIRPMVTVNNEKKVCTNEKTITPI